MLWGIFSIEANGWEMFGKFKRDRISTNNSERSGRSKYVITTEIIEKIHDIVLDDLKVKVHEWAEDLGIRKLTSKWVPRFLTIDWKRQRVRDWKSCLDHFNRYLSNFLRRLVTIDETWINYYTPESKEQAKKWVGPSGTAPKRAKTQNSLERIWLLIFEIPVAYCLSAIWKKGKQSTATSTIHYWIIWKKKSQKTAYLLKKKGTFV